MSRDDAGSITKEQLLANCRQAIVNWTAARSQARKTDATPKPIFRGEIGADVDFGK